MSFLATLRIVVFQEFVAICTYSASGGMNFAVLAADGLNWMNVAGIVNYVVWHVKSNLQCLQGFGAKAIPQSFASQDMGSNRIFRIAKGLFTIYMRIFLYPQSWNRNILESFKDQHVFGGLALAR